MKYYVSLDLKGTAKVNQTHSQFRDQIDTYSDERQLSKFVPIPGGLSIRSFLNNIAIYDPKFGYNMMNYATAYDRGIFCGGSYSFPLSESIIHNNISYITISSCGNSEDFGELSKSRGMHSCVSNGVNSRALILGGGYSTISLLSADYLNILSRSNAISYDPVFYNSIEKRGHSTISNNVGNIAVTFGSNFSTSQYPCEYTNIQTLSDSEYFSSLITNRYNLGGVSNGILNRGIVIGGENSSGVVNNSEYFNFEIIQEATMLFGNLSNVKWNVRSVSNNERNTGCYSCGDVSNLNCIDYIRISYLSDAVLFGYMSDKCESAGSCSNGINNRGVYFGIYNSSSSIYNRIEFITLSHWNSACKFGDLWTSHFASEGTSNA